MRKTSVAALAAFLVITAFLSQAQAQRKVTPYILGPNEWGSCCTGGYIQRALPLKILTSYEQTSAKCILPAVIFTTKHGKRYCADPQAEWTLALIRALDGNDHVPRPPVPPPLKQKRKHPFATSN